MARRLARATLRKKARIAPGDPSGQPFPPWAFT
jgi:hypothetical protein